MRDLPEQASVTDRRSISQPFRPRARVLQLLGDELIGSDRLAVFERVKNAYDADASEAVVRLDLASTQEPMITVTVTVTDDDGEGMTLDVLLLHQELAPPARDLGRRWTDMDCFAAAYVFGSQVPVVAGI